jgi:GTP-binding protein YchF
LELVLADLQVLEKRRDSRRNAAKNNDPKLKAEVELYTRLCEHFEKGQPARTFPFTDNERELIKESQLLTTKPILYVTNVDETGNLEAVKVVKDIAAKEGAGVVAISAKLEAEVAELSPEEAKEFRASLGIEFGLDNLIKESYKLLGLITYFTAGEPEARAWTINRGDKAPQAAGKIHSDFERGFIAADVIHYADFHRLHEYQKLKDAGLVRTEGKEYVVQDGDWMVFRFNV